VRPSTSSGPDDVELPRESQVHDIRCKYRKGAAKRKIKRLRHSLISKLDFVSALGDRIGEKKQGASHCFAVVCAAKQPYSAT
jgi:hypothetical protein